MPVGELLHTYTRSWRAADSGTVFQPPRKAQSALPTELVDNIVRSGHGAVLIP